MILYKPNYLEFRIYSCINFGFHIRLDSDGWMLVYNVCFTLEATLLNISENLACGKELNVTR